MTTGMTLQGWTLILVFTALVLALARPMGAWLFALYEGRRTPLHRVLGPLETGFYRLAGIDPGEAVEAGFKRAQHTVERRAPPLVEREEPGPHGPRERQHKRGENEDQGPALKGHSGGHRQSFRTARAAAARRRGRSAGRAR